MKPVALALLCLSCGSARAPCSPEALGDLYSELSVQVVRSGLCDKYKGRAVTECPAYKVIEDEFTAAAEASCLRN